MLEVEAMKREEEATINDAERLSAAKVQKVVEAER